ncbi:MAG: Mut7-C RNAse domain-containing protein [Candidatus Limnocylindrales bacterium]
MLTPSPGRVARSSTATFRFYGELNDHLPDPRRQVSFLLAFDGEPAVKDAIEAVGVPHPEVDAIVVNDVPVGFAYRMRDGDRVNVYPPARSGWHAAEARPDGLEPLTPPIPRPPRFILDTHLGRLARYLRMLGFDSAYSNRADDDELARRSSAEGRVLLTRDRGLLRRRVVRLGYLLRSDDPRRQLVEVSGRYGLAEQVQPFSRCIRCNGRIEPVEKAEVAQRLAPRTLRYYDSFGRCDSCTAVYWQGSHYERMQRLVRTVLEPQ